MTLPTPIVYGLDLLDDAADLLWAGCLPPGVAGAIITGSGSLLASSNRLPSVDPLLDVWTNEKAKAVKGPLPGCRVSPGPIVDQALLDGWAVSR